MYPLSLSHQSPTAARHPHVSRHPRWMRGLAIFLTFVMIWTFGLAAPAQCLAHSAPKKARIHINKAARPPHIPAKPSVPYVMPPAIREALQHNAVPLTPEQVHRLPARYLSGSLLSSPTLLDEVGRLAHPLPAAHAAAWNQRLHEKSLTAGMAAQLHLWLGEWQLAANEQPEAALAHFKQAQKLVKRFDVLYGLAAYDTAITHYYEGAYAQATEEFHRLLLPKTALAGYDRNNCTLFWRHAGACAGYHKERAQMGIPEPARLDPLCAVSALAACLRGLHRPYDKKTVLSACRATGLGSSATDILAAAKKLNVSARVVTADDQGLMALPKPLVAHVERDHFIAIMQADKQGVTYLCSDCGAYPGGLVQITWDQFHVLDAGFYIPITAPNSLWDQALERALSRTATANKPVQVASSVPVPPLNLLVPRQVLTLVSLLKGHVLAYLPPDNGLCTFRFGSLHCPPMTHCPKHCPPSAEPAVENAEFTGLGAESTGRDAGPSAGDPVNLATGEEEYEPHPDLEIYNPSGPSITWQRIYNSLRSFDLSSTGRDFGTGWSHNYNYFVYDPSLTTDNPQAASGGDTTLVFSGTEAPLGAYQTELDSPTGGLLYPFDRASNPSGLFWSGEVIGPNNQVLYWGNTLYSFILDGTPGNVLPPGTNYEARSRLSGSPASTFFDLIPNAAFPAVAAPIGLSASLGSGRVALSWNKVAGAAYYNVYRANSNTNTWTPFLVGNGPWRTIGSYLPIARFVDSGLTNGVTYTYRVSALNASLVEGSTSGVLKATPLPRYGPAHPQVPQGSIAALAQNGKSGPAGANAWDILNASNQVIASQANPNGWIVASRNYTATSKYAPGQTTVYVPTTGSAGTYTLRASANPTGPWSVSFDVIASSSFNDGSPLYGTPGSRPGLKYLVMPNGSRLGFTASSVPTAANPRVACPSMTGGVPYLLEWDYDPALPGGHYTVTRADRSRMVMAATDAHWQYAPIAQIIDRNGNAITFHYQAPTGTHFPLLSSITNTRGTTLLTINRVSDTSINTGNITSVSDAYNRSVYYQIGTYAGSPALPIPFQELNQVSQIVTTNTQNPPMRYTYGYTALTAVEAPNPQVYHLSTITVPSPTGIRVTTATIDYTPDTGLVQRLTDANGNYANISPIIRGAIDPSKTIVYVGSPTSNDYTYVVSFDQSMNETSHTDGTTFAPVSSMEYGAIDPYEPTSEADGNALYSMKASTTAYFFPGGTDSAAGQSAWDIVLNGTVIDHGAAEGIAGANGWSADEISNKISVTAPATARVAPHYEVRIFRKSAYFDVVTNMRMPTQYVWDTYGNLRQMTSPRGTVTNYTWAFPGTPPTGPNGVTDPTAFAMGELRAIQKGTKTATTFTYYEPSGLFKEVDEPMPGTSGTGVQVATTYTYDNLGNLLTETGPGNNATPSITTTFNYTTDGAYTQAAAINQPLTRTDNLGKVTHLRYNPQGRPIARIDALGNEGDFSYNIANQLQQVTIPHTGGSGPGRASVVNTYLYPNGPQTGESRYDESGVLVRQTNYGYGYEGEMLSATGSTQTAIYAYDGAYRLLKHTDGNNHATSYHYNATGYVDQAVLPNSNGTFDTIKFPTRDNSGNVLVRIDGRGIETDLTYDDPENLLTATTYVDSALYPNNHLSNSSYSYDAYGRIASTTDGTGNRTLGYDDLDNKTRIDTTYVGLPTKTISYSYFPDGMRKTMSTPGGNFTYSYDGAGRLNGLTNPYNEITTWNYLDNDWLSKQSMYNSGGNVVSWRNYLYNPAGQLATLENRTSNNGFFSQYANMLYDGAGKRTTMTASITSAPALSGQFNYAYDIQNQLTQEQVIGPNGYTHNFAFDGAGNPTTFKNVTNIGYNADNQNVAPGYAYDGNGNPTSYQNTAFTFDPENRLTGIGNLLQAGYRADGLRGWKQTTSGRTYFLLDVYGLPVCELDASGNVKAVNTFGIAGLVSRQVSGSGSVYYTFDPRGNVAQRLDQTGTVLGSYLFTAFGQRTGTDNSTDPYTGFGGQAGYYTDWETGLQLLGHRYYDAGTGRFITRDPIGLSGEDLNLYRYVGNQPITRSDPTGFFAGPTHRPKAPRPLPLTCPYQRNCSAERSDRYTRCTAEQTFEQTSLSNRQAIDSAFCLLWVLLAPECLRLLGIFVESENNRIKAQFSACWSMSDYLYAICRVQKPQDGHDENLP